MTRLLAVDWDENEVRFLLGNLKNDQLTVLKTGAASLDADDESGETVGKGVLSPPVFSALQVLLKDHHVEKCRTILVLGRWNLELHHLTLPASREEDLPAMVRNVMLREMGTFSELDPIDYLTLTGSETEERQLALVTISAVKRQKLATLFRGIGRPLTKIEYRGAAAAELLTHRLIKPESEKLGLAVTLLNREVELTMLLGNRLADFRSFKIPETADEAEATERVVSEIVRTATVGLPEITDLPVETLYLFRAGDEWQGLADKLADRSFEIVPVDPFALPGITCAHPPESPSRFASLLGALLAAAPGKRPTFDLLDPKERPKPPNIARWIVFAILFLGICGYALYQWNALAIQQLKEEADKLETEVKTLAEGITGLRNPYFFLSRAQAWDNQGANWLDELRDLSVVFPEAEDLVMTQMTFQAGPINRNPNIIGQIQLRGMVRDPAVLRMLQAKLQAGRYHRMSTPVPTRNPAGGGYPWLFSATIYCFRRPNAATYLTMLPVELQRESYQAVQPAAVSSPPASTSSPSPVAETPVSPAPLPTGTPVAPSPATTTPPESPPATPGTTEEATP